MNPYDHNKIEKKWQKVWESKKPNKVKEDSKKPKFYALIEFPFPSGDGLHVGHIRSNTAMDIIARKRRMEGFNVLYPIGWDAFGLPTENYAIKTGIQPAIVSKKNSDTFRKQLKALGFSFDWSREIDTTDPKYYKWTQWIFLQFFKKGLAYKKRMTINWCPKDLIGLANEEVVNGCCERCGTVVEQKEKEQWMLAITKYAERLDKDLDDTDFLEKIKIQQRNWIGKSEGAEIDFSIKSNYNFVLLHGFTANPDSDFYPWLKNKLEKLGHRVQVPKLPNTDKPTEEEQVNFVLDNVKFDENTVVLGHSLGSVVAMKVLEKLNKKIAGLILAGGFVDTEFKDHDRNFDKTFNWNFDFDKIKSNTGFIKVLHDKNDDAITYEQAQRLANALGVPIEEFIANESHFTSKEEPLILEAIQPSIKVFTTRPDTLFGVTYMVISPEHSLIKDLINKIENRKEVEKYIEEVKTKTTIERTDIKSEKTGIELKGIKVINPANQEEVPVWIADYVLADYGTGAVMAVPSHDERDMQFSKKYNLPVKEIELLDKKEITEKVGGKWVTNFKLRDWIFSRQRYWGEPIPVVHCEKCGIVALPEKDLPLKLPKVENYTPSQTGESPLAKIDKWVNTKCPNCKGKAKRETDTMPNWAGSSWYYLRYTDPKNKKEFASQKNLNYWGQVDWYNGGMEHTTLHLLYSRFWHKFLFDLGLVPNSEPYKKRTSHGLILAEGGEKMSKSKGNVINPDTIIQTVGADTLRVHEMFMGPFDQAIAWDTNTIAGSRRFIERVWKLKDKIGESDPSLSENENLEILLNKTIKKVSEDIEEMKFNTAISAMMIALNELEKQTQIPKNHYEIFIKLLAPFAPHVAEELWTLMKNKGSIHASLWPKFDPEKTISSQVKIMIQINGKVRAFIEVPTDTDEDSLKSQVLEMDEVKKWLNDLPPKKIIFVKNRLINIVV